jgi:hypothetical protein
VGSDAAVVVAGDVGVGAGTGSCLSWFGGILGLAKAGVELIRGDGT